MADWPNCKKSEKAEKANQIFYQRQKTRGNGRKAKKAKMFSMNFYSMGKLLACLTNVSHISQQNIRIFFLRKFYFMPEI